MTRRVAVSEFRDRASELIAAAEAGEEIVITRHGKPAAKLVGVIDEAAIREHGLEAWRKLSELRDRLHAEGRTATIEEIVEWKNEGRR